MSKLKDIIYTSKDIGEIIKSTKHHFIWGFTLDDKRVVIQFYISKMSNKRKIIYNQEVVQEDNRYYSNSYSYEFAIDGHNYKVVEIYDKVDLLVDSESFEHLYNSEKTKKTFLEKQKPNV